MKQEILLLQDVMKKHDLAMYLVPTSDEHQSEYIPEAYKFRAFLSGFIGSAGTLLVTQEACLLWTDGRYFIQAEKQLENTGIILMRSGEKNVETVLEYISSHIKKNDKFGFNGVLFSYNQIKNIIQVITDAKAHVVDIDLSTAVWEKRPAIFVGKIGCLDLMYTGQTIKEKLTDIRKSMDRVNADVHIISSLDDIAWLFNLRGNDIPYNPVFYSYGIISKEDAKLFVKAPAVNEKIKKLLQKENVEILEYDSFFDYIEKNYISNRVLLDANKINYRTYQSLLANNEIIDQDNPSVLLKAIKTETECENIRIAHRWDGLTMTRFIYWIKKQMEDNVAITECDAADYLDNLRLEHEECTDLSFDTIAAYGENAAMCHYSPDRSHPVLIKKQGFLLVDSGGQYRFGTTDVTRTIAVGSLSQIQKEHYTLVLQGHIRLSIARFPEGICGANLDILARGPLWERGLDFNHGTGHGVGYYLNVHEGPNNIYWNLQRKTAKAVPFQSGMLTSNEPGVYLENQYGIRIENLMLTRSVCHKNISGFLEFDTVTLVPYEREAIIPEMLSDEELKWLNSYHEQLYSIYEKMLSEEEQNWLKVVTEPLLKVQKECYNQ